MKRKSHAVSDSDDSESVDDPSPVPLVESTCLDTEGNSNNQNKDSDSENEVVARSQSNSSKNSANVRGKKSSTELNTTKKKSSEKDKTEVQATFSVKDLSSDDEVYIFHCAAGFKKQDLLNKFIDVSKSKQFVHTKEGQKFQLEILNSENKKVTLAVPKTSLEGKLVNLPLKGHMIIKKPVEIQTNLINYVGEAEDTVEFPADIKIRHPFLGVNWKSHCDEAKQSIEKNHSTKNLGKKRKKEKTEEKLHLENVKINQESFSEESSPKKKRKKHDW